MGFGRAGNGLVWSEVWVGMLNRAWILRHSSRCDIGCVAQTHGAHDAQPTMRVLTDEKRKGGFSWFSRRPIRFVLAPEKLSSLANTHRRNTRLRGDAIAAVA